MKRIIVTYRWFLALMGIDLLILILTPQTGQAVFKFTFSNFYQMLGILPPIFILLGLLDVWVPRQTMIRYLGEGSGLLGITISIVLGAAAAGPLYGAFPIAAVMAKKGAKFSNILIFIGSWSTLKIPMFLFEVTSLGTGFAITRALVDIPVIIIMAWIIQRAMPQSEIDEFYRRHQNDEVAS